MCEKGRFPSSKPFASYYDGRRVYCITAEKINKVLKSLLYLENEVSRVQLEGVFDAVLAKPSVIKLILKSEILKEIYALCHK
jgi:hypothetical protein